MFDNVGKKLQQSINNIVKIVPTQGSGPAFWGSKSNSKSKDGQGSNQYHNYHHPNQQLFKQSGTQSVEKNKPSIINY